MVEIIIISRRPRIDRSQIGQPMNFRHTGHVGSTDLGWEFQKIFRSALRPCHMDAIKDAIFDIWCEMFAFNAEFPLFFNNLSPSCQCASDHEGSNQANFLSSNSGLVLSNKICLLINLFKVKLSAWPESTFKTFSTLQVYSHPSVPDERKRGRVRKPGGNLIRYNLKAAKTNLWPNPSRQF